MKYYTGHYGSWANGGSVRTLKSTYNRKEIMAQAQKVANETGLTVTVMSEYPTGRGLFCETVAYVKPE